MKNGLRTRKAAVLAGVVFVLFVHLTKSNSAMLTLPQPQLVFAGTEDYAAGGKQWTRYKLSVCNRSEYPDAMFAPAPDLPPCGRNTKSARSWVDIYSRDGKRLYGFCALGSSDNLKLLWFAVETGVA